jgi:hypothetical protein
LSLGQVQVEGVDLAVVDILNDLCEAGGVAGARRGQVDHCAGAVLPEDEQIHVPDESLARGAGAGGAGPLDGGDAADQGADLGVPQLRARRELADQDVLGVADELVVDLAVPPPVAVREQGRWLPGGEDVELRMSVQVDQPGQDDPAGVQHVHPGRSVLLDGGDLLSVDHDVPRRPRRRRA